VAYGIYEEKSDLRAHVGVLARTVYVYPTQPAITFLLGSNGTYRQAPVYTGEVQTARGYLVPPSHIPSLRTVSIPDHIMQQAAFAESDSTSDKGAKAVRIIKWLLATGRFPLRLDGREISDLDMQIQGLDIIVHTNLRIQVKCDWRASLERSKPVPACTGNLFIQTHECNPYRQV